VTFTIVASPTGSIKEYNLPADFFVVSATLNGETASYSRSYVDMTGDGDYEICYRSPAADKELYLAVTVDHTPPMVTLTGITDGKANEPVTVADLEDGAEIFLDRNGKEIPFNGVIDETGSYVLTVKDEAGNETNYDFVVITYEKTDMKYLIILGVVLLAALAGYFVYYKKNIRVN